MSLVCALWLLLGGSTAYPNDRDVDDTAGTGHCRECHDYGSESQIQGLLQGSHGISVEAGFQHGCEDCHGASAAHASAPREISPATSFGPRWSSSSASQDGPCLGCHENNTQADWQHSLHMLNNLTCVTCHDIHSDVDRVLFNDLQAEVCTMCHKAQKKGVHGLGEDLREDPPCSSCHNPHNHESAQPQMQSNQSMGCRHCHDLAAIADNPLVSTKARNYHRAMQQPGRTCLDCHQGIAHAPTDSAPPIHTVPAQAGRITLFYPGIAASDWLLRVHPGSQPLRQGTSCQRCHRGEEAALGKSRAGAFEPASRDVELSFTLEDEQLVLTLQWQGSPDDSSIALMWGDARQGALGRGGCFAACHSDLPGMSQDQGQQIGKYLKVSRLQRPAVGKNVTIKDGEALRQLTEAGEAAQLWQVVLASSALRRGLLLDDVHWHSDNLISVDKKYLDGKWTLVLGIPINTTELGMAFTSQGKYTFGVALNSTSNPGGKHWVSLPMTLSFNGDDTDFTAE